jgi:protein-S-isoprenylcysteine O-methyltransferase Ste14
MKKAAVFLYGLVVYTLFFVTFLYLIGFVGNLLVPKSIDGALDVPLWQAILTNIGLISLLGLQHSLMARGWFKKVWTRFVPEPIERSTYVLFTVFALVALFIFWQPMGIYVWSIDEGLLYGILMAVFALGWTIVLISTFMITHFDLFGLRQTWLYLLGKPYEPLKFRINIFYNYVRHPLYLGMLLALWAAPVMSLARFILALGFTVYVLMAIQWEEKDLIQHFGKKYIAYKKLVPMLIPTFISKKTKLKKEEHPVF